jgi:hypothetical protein
MLSHFFQGAATIYPAGIPIELDASVAPALRQSVLFSPEWTDAHSTIGRSRKKQIFRTKT